VGQLSFSSSFKKKKKIKERKKERRSRAELSQNKMHAAHNEFKRWMLQ
jgi:hypothetical protein